MMAPTAFNVVTSAQVLLAAQLKNKITKSFAKFKEEAKEGKLTEDQIKTQYAGYRKDTIDADVINSSNVQDVLSDIISEDYYEKHLREEALLKQRLDESLAHEVEKDAELQKANERILELEKSRKEQHDQQTRKLNNVLQRDIKNLVSQRKVTESKIQKINKKINCRETLLKVLSYVLAGAFLITVVFLCYKFGYNNVGSIITIILFVLAGLNLILIREGKKPKQNWITKLASRSRQRLFEEYDIDENSLSEIDSEIASLKEELE